MAFDLFALTVKILKAAPDSVAVQWGARTPTYGLLDQEGGVDADPNGAGTVFTTERVLTVAHGALAGIAQDATVRATRQGLDLTLAIRSPALLHENGDMDRYRVTVVT